MKTPVYVVFGDYSEDDTRNIVGIFSNKEQAENRMKEEIEEILSVDQVMGSGKLKFHYNESDDVYFSPNGPEKVWCEQHDLDTGKLQWVWSELYEALFCMKNGNKIAVVSNADEHNMFSVNYLPLSIVFSVETVEKAKNIVEKLHLEINNGRI